MSDLQSHLSLIQRWCNIWHITINESKSSNITFTPNKIPTPNVYISGNVLPRKTEVKYLGYMEVDLAMKKQIDTTIKQLN